MIWNVNDFGTRSLSTALKIEMDLNFPNDFLSRTELGFPEDFDAIEVYVLYCVA